jgi:hypothetical protein
MCAANTCKKCDDKTVDSLCSECRKEHKSRSIADIVAATVLLLTSVAGLLFYDLSLLVVLLLLVASVLFYRSGRQQLDKTD